MLAFLVGCEKDPTVAVNFNLQACISAGNGQNGFLGEELPHAVVILVKDKKGNPYNDAILEYSKSVSNGQPMFTTISKGYNGLYSNFWLLGCTSSNQVLKVVVYDSKGRLIDTLAFSATGINHDGWRRSSGYFPEVDGGRFSYASSNGIKMHPDGSLYFISDSVYKSLDSGHTWFSVTNFPGGYFDRPSELCITDDGVILIGSDIDGIFRSTDDGATWTKSIKGINTPTGIQNLIQISDQDVFCETVMASYRSKDNGLNWSPSGFNLEHPRSIVRVSNNDLFACEFFLNGLYRSEDDGASWKPFDTDFKNITALQVDEAGNLLVMEMDGDIPMLYKSMDEGQSWSKISTLYTEEGYSFSIYHIQCFNGNYYIDNLDGINRITTSGTITRLTYDLPADMRQGDFMVIGADKIVLVSYGILCNF
jgi:photosystem II stability/assembly factor-like uncharacterized protein